MDTPTSVAAVIVGSGPAGLATAAELEALGVPALVLERGHAAGAAWEGRYDALRFNTSRRRSALPGAPFPRPFGQFPTRDQYVGYLREYAAAHALQVEYDTEVVGLAAADGGGARWRVSTSRGELVADHVVIATGIFNEPVLPAWAKDSAFRGTVLHTAAYKNAAPFVNQDVLVVGAGSSGMEIAYDLATHGARRVMLSYRTPPSIIFRQMGGVPGDLPVPLFLHLPTGLVDRLLLRLQRLTVGDLTPFGLPAPPEGPISQLKARGAGTAIVDREVIDAIRARTIECVPPVVGLGADGAVLADGHRTAPDAVIVATGYSTGLHRLVGHLDVLDAAGMPLDRLGGEALPGLRFVGYVYRPGLTGYVGKIAARAAREIAAAHTAVPAVA